MDLSEYNYTFSVDTYNHKFIVRAGGGGEQEERLDLKQCLI